MDRILDEKEERALNILNASFHEWNGKSLRLWDHELHHAGPAGYSIKNHHVSAINLKLDRPYSTPATWEHRFDDPQKINQMIFIPDVLSEFPCLERLYLEGLYTIIPEFVFELNSLKELRLFSLYVEHIPDKFDHLTNLELLILSDCIRLPQLPESIGRCPNLRFLRIQNLPVIWNIPDSFTRLEKIEVLEISHAGLMEIPPFIFELPHLRLLKVTRCSELKLTEAILNLPFDCVLRLDEQVVQQSSANIREEISNKAKFSFAFISKEEQQELKKN
jgi:hypothetical protein